MADLKSYIKQVADGRRLSRAEAEAAFDIMMSGEATPAQIGGFLMLLRAHGETIEEIAGAVASMRSKMTRVEAPDDAIDIVGTGGDASGTYNISTATAFVVAGCGVPIAKHGNRALSSRSGAADCLKALGVNLELTPKQISTCIHEAGIGFMFAPAHHPAMRHVGPARVELGTRTIFNLLGPLSNPAGVKRQMTGVFAKQWVEPLAEVLKDLGSERVMVVHGADGLDEITTTTKSYFAELKNGTVTTGEIHPDDVGIAVAQPESLKGGDAEDNAAALRRVLEGLPSSYLDAVIFNAACALQVAGIADDWSSGIERARQSVETGAAAERLAKLVAVSNGV